MVLLNKLSLLWNDLEIIAHQSLELMSHYQKFVKKGKREVKTLGKGNENSGRTLH